jgi:hypothetical protein
MPPPKRPSGRPRLDPEQPSVSVHVRLSTAAYDELYAAASRERVSLATLMRQRIARSLERSADH